MDNRRPRAAALSIPSPLAGEGQGGGCRAPRRLGLHNGDSDLLLRQEHLHQTPILELPPSPALPHRKSGLPDLRKIKHNPGKPGLWGGGSNLHTRSDRDLQGNSVQRCPA